MSDLEQRYQGKAKVIHINIDQSEAKPYLDKYHVLGTPTILLIDRHGKVAANVPGFTGETAVANALDKLVAQP